MKKLSILLFVMAFVYATIFGFDYVILSFLIFYLIVSIAKKNNITIIEDCAQSQGAKYKNKFCGTFGKFGCFSFYPTKILGAYGDGGFIFTNDFKAFKQIKRLRFYGIETMGKNKFKNKYFANENAIENYIIES